MHRAGFRKIRNAAPAVALVHAHLAHELRQKGLRNASLRLGKITERGGRLVMPVSVQAHHSFVDGLHVARFAERLQAFFDGGIEGK